MPEKEHEQKIPIVVFGTDRKGEMFQEDTVTTVVARTWVKMRVRHSLELGASIVIFNKLNGSQAEFVVDSNSAPNEVKSELRDHTVDIWQLDFGLPPQAAPDLRRRLHLVCIRCQTRETVPLEEYELDKLERTGRLSRHCPECATDTEWEKESAAQARAAEEAQRATATEREKGEQEKRTREEREAQLRRELGAALLAESDARAAADRARRAAEEAAAKEAAEAARRAEAEASARSAEEAARRVEVELTGQAEARLEAQRQSKEAAARIHEAESAGREASRAAETASKAAERGTQVAEELQRKAEEAIRLAEQARQQAQNFVRKLEEVRNKAEAAERALEEAQAAKEAAEQRLQALLDPEEARKAKAEAEARAKQSKEEAARLAAVVSKAAQAAAEARRQAEEAGRAVEAATAARLQAEAALAELTAPPPEPPKPAPAAEPAIAATGPISWEDRRSSRRIQVKTRARIRRAVSTEIAEPINVSRGGICFESRASYELDEVVWVAMHYREGAENLETPSRIVRVSPGGKGNSYGVKFEA